MSSTEFRQHGAQMVDYIADYVDTVHNRRVVPSIGLVAHSSEPLEHFYRTWLSERIDSTNAASGFRGIRKSAERL